MPRNIASSANSCGVIIKFLLIIALSQLVVFVELLQTLSDRARLHERRSHRSSNLSSRRQWTFPPIDAFSSACGLGRYSAWHQHQSAYGCKYSNRRASSEIVRGSIACNRTSSSKRIAGGRPLIVEEFPFFAHVIIWAPRDDGGENLITCGGVIIHKNLVLTAAHCATHKGADMSVKVGATNAASVMAAEINVSLSCPSPLYTGRTVLTNDFAVLRLSQDLVYSDTVQPVCLVTHLTPKPEADCVLLGAGSTESKRTQTEDARVLYVRPAICPPLDISFTCFISSESKPSRPCPGDSGGPVLCFDSCDLEPEARTRAYLAGVLSSGPDPNCILGDSITFSANIPESYRQLYQSIQNCLHHPPPPVAAALREH